MAAPEYWRAAIGNSPKYFVHVAEGNESLFGLSKFCAFENISLQDYVAIHRRRTGGGTTQKVIAKLCQQQWIPLKQCSPKMRRAFITWFNEASDGRLGLENIHIISLAGVRTESELSAKNPLPISPAELAERLKKQAEIGRVGEAIALRYEMMRLKSRGAKDAEKFIEHVSLKNAAAGFDIRSEYAREARYIEVKSSTKPGSGFYISPNEKRALTAHGLESYLYLVHVTDIKNESGEVVLEINNPFAKDKSKLSLTPALYYAELTNEGLEPRGISSALEEEWPD